MILDGHFSFPLYRDYVLSGGGGSVSPDSVKYKLTEIGPGHSVWIAIGGAAEAFLSTPSSYKLKLATRKGFVKMALKTGASLVPVFSFGETKLFEQKRPTPGSKMFNLQERARNWFGFAPVIFKGRWFNPLMPFRTPVDTVVGAAIDVPKIEKPTQEDIDHWHKVYLDELIKLFESHKEQFGDRDKTLEFC